MEQNSSRQRMLAALGQQEVDQIPCCFMSFTALRKKCHEDMVELASAELGLGLDSMLFIPSAPRPQRPDHPDLRGLPVRFHSQVKTRIWHEKSSGEYDILHREYDTPAGKLNTSVRLSDDWPHGEHLPFVDDYQVPRALKPLITQPEDLAALQYLLVPPSDEDMANFQAEAANARRFTDEKGILLVGGWGVGVDMACWLCGIQNLTMLAIDQPDFVTQLLEMIHVWNLRRMEIVLSAPVDLYIRRAWYEGCDFLTPRFFRQTILPGLKAEASLAHERGAKFGYICSSGTRPMLDFYPEAGVDVLIGIDPIQGTYTNMKYMKQKLQGKVALWGGVSGAITVEMGTEGEIRSAVRQAIADLGPQGVILSPVDNITIDAPRTWQNVDIFIDEWRKQAAR